MEPFIQLVVSLFQVLQVEGQKLPEHRGTDQFTGLAIVDHRVIHNYRIIVEIVRFFHCLLCLSVLTVLFYIVYAALTKHFKAEHCGCGRGIERIAEITAVGNIDVLIRLLQHGLTQSAHFAADA